MKITSVSFDDITLELSGSFIVFNNSETKLIINIVKDVNFELIFEFTNTADEKIEIIPVVESQRAHLKFRNFNNPLGTGSTQPIQMGIFNNVAIFFNYRIHALDDKTDKTFFYSFYSQKITQPKEQKDGSIKS